MTHEQAFDRLTAKGIITPLGPTADPPVEKRSKFLDANKYCKYHRGRGHSTEKCWSPKNLLQDMVEHGRLPVPPEMENPNTQTSSSSILELHPDETVADPILSIAPQEHPRVTSEESTWHQKKEMRRIPLGTVPRLTSMTRIAKMERKYTSKILMRKRIGIRIT